MTVERASDILNENQVAIHNPETFDVKNYIDKFLSQSDTTLETFSPVGMPDIRIDFFQDYRPDDTPFCTVIADDMTGQHILLSENERGHVEGHINEVAHYFKENCPDGFYSVDEAGDKIENYQELFEPVDTEYLEHLAEFAEFEPEPEIYYSIDTETGELVEGVVEGPLMPEIYLEDVEPEPDLSNASMEEQLEFVLREMEPGGKVDQLLKDIAQIEYRADAGVKLEELGVDRTVSEKVQEYFTPSEEKAPYFEIMQRGFIPYELREGFSDNRIEVNPDLKLTEDIVREVRGKIDPDFGMVAGIDTTKFYTRNEEGIPRNISIIPMSYEDIKPHLYGDEQFQKEDVVSVRAIKEYGESMEVQGAKFGVNNLVTIEVKTQDNEVYRSSLIMDDSGTARARLDFMAGDYQHTFRFETGNDFVGGDKITLIHFDKLDRTNVDNKGHFPVMDGKDEKFREAFLSEVEDRLPGFFEDMIDRMDHELDPPQGSMDIGRRDYMEVNLDDLKARFSSLHNVTNLVELYKDNLEAKAYRANQLCAELDDKINFADMDRKEFAPDSKEYKEISDKIESYKSDYAKAYSDYLDNRDKFNKISVDADEIRSKYFELGRRLDHTQDEFDKLFEYKSANGSGRDTDNSKLSAEERYSKFCDIALLRQDMVPTDISYDFGELVEEKAEVLKEAFEGIADIVEKYNETVDSPFEKIVFTDALDFDSPISAADGGVYTASGFEVEAPSIAKEKDVCEQYSPMTNYEPYKDVADLMDRKPQPDTKGEIYESHASIYALGKPDGTDRTRVEIRDDFLKQEIHLGAEKRDISITDHSLSGKMLDTGLLHELDAIRMTVSDHRGENFDNLEPYRAEIDAYRAPMDEKTARIGIAAEEAKPADMEIHPEREEDYTERQEERQDKNDANIENRIRSSFGEMQGKVDEKKDVELSDKKKEELQKEAEEEAKHSDKSVDEIYQEKAEKLKEILGDVKSDILNFKDKMSGFDDIPNNRLNQHCGYQLAKTEYGSAIHIYEELGGKVGKDAFVTKGVSSRDLFFTKVGLQSSNFLTTKLFDANAGIDTKARIQDVYMRKDGVEATRYSGRIGAFLENRYGFLNAFAWPMEKLTNFCMKIMDTDIHGFIEKIEKIKYGDMERKEAAPMEKEPKQDAEVMHAEGKPDVESSSIENEGKEMETSEKMQEVNRPEEKESMEAANIEHKPEEIEKPDNLEEKEPIDRDESQDDKQKEAELEKDKEDLEQKEEDLSADEKQENLVEQPEKEVEQEEKPEVERPETEERPEVERPENEEKPEVERPEDEMEKSDTDKDQQEKEDTKKEEDPEDKEDTKEDKESKVEKEEEEDLEKPEPDDVEPEPEDMEKPEELPEENKVEEPEEPDQIEKESGEDQETSVKNDKDDAMASQGEDLTQEDAYRIEGGEDVDVQAEDDGEDEEPAKVGHAASEEEEEQESLRDKIENVLDGKEEMNNIIRDALDDILHGADPTEILDNMTNALTDCISDHMGDLEAVSDMIYDIANTFADSPIEAIDDILGKLEEVGVPEGVTDFIQEHLANLFDQIEFPYEDVSYGEYGDFEFDGDGVFDAATGNEDLDYDLSSDLQDFMTDAMDFADVDTLANDMDILNVAADIESDLEAQGFAPDVAMDTSANLFDQISQDASSGVDVFADDYQQTLQEQSLEQAQDMADTMNSMEQATMPDEMPMSGVDNGADFTDMQGVDAFGSGAEGLEAAEGMEAADMAALLL